MGHRPPCSPAQLLTSPLEALPPALTNTRRGPGTAWRRGPNTGPPQQRPGKALAAGAAPLGQEAGLETERPRPCIGLLHFRQGHKLRDVKPSNSLYTGTPAAEQTARYTYITSLDKKIQRQHHNSSLGWIISSHITLKVKLNVKREFIEKTSSTSFYPRINLNNSENLVTERANNLITVLQMQDL